MNHLEKIIAQKRVRLERARAARSLDEMLEAGFEARRGATPHALRGALSSREGFNVIAEIKRASPSKGVISASVDPAEVSASYEAGGACAVSVLTEEDSFQGSLEDLRVVRRAVGLPLLRKDFIFDEYQLYEAAEAGADALLLIVAALDDESLTHFRRVTEEELGMDALVEVHTEEELQRASDCGATLVGVNNRDLQTFQVSLEVSFELARLAAPGATLVSESGLKSREDLSRLRAAGYRGFLIGETLMRAGDPEKTLRELLKEEEKSGVA
jgi:indole-3-glycerol phosphate synthase